MPKRMRDDDVMVKILKRWNGIVCGAWELDKRMFTKWVGPEHEMYKDGLGWGIQYPIFEDLKRDGCETVCLEYTEAGITTKYYANFSDYVRYGRIRTVTVKDGKQIFLADSYFV